MHKAMIYNGITFDITLQIFKKSLTFSDHKYKENVAKNTMYLVMLLAVKRKL